MMQRVKSHKLFCLLCALAACSWLGLAAAAQLPKPPQTRADNVVEQLHGTAVSDPYRWLEDQQSQETRAWIDAQNKYTDALLKPLPMRAALQKRAEALLKIDTISAPSVRSGRYFFSKRAANQNQSVYYMRQGLKGPDEVLLDSNQASADQRSSYAVLGSSRDGKLLAYGLRAGGEDETTLQFMETDTKQTLGDKFPRARYSDVQITPDRKGFYYSRLNDQGSRVFYHSFGSEPQADRLIFGEGLGWEKGVGVQLSEDGRHLFLTVRTGTSGRKTEIYWQDLTRGSDIKPLVNDIEANFRADVAGDYVFLTTNWNAPNWRVLRVELKNPARENWREVIPTNPKAVLSGVSTAGRHLFANYLEDVKARVVVYNPDGQRVREISFPTIGVVGGVGGNWESDEAFFTFSSFTTPQTIFRYEAAQGKQSEWARINVPVKTDRFEVKQVWYESKDKTRVPMFIVHQRGIKLDGSHPCYLTGYGGFNLSRTPGFSAQAALWVESGGVYALPNLRGGGEYGEAWHKAGMFENKQNVFDDFIAAAEWLVKNGYTNPKRLAITGGSNGGLLVGAAFTQRPDLYQAVICSVPLLDMVRYHKFLLGRYWVSEYGSADEAQQFPYLYKYSPYHNVKAGTKYPAILFVTGDADTRVAPLHARKMTALVQAATGSERPVLLHYDTKAGHSGGQPVNKQIENLVDEFSFLFWQLGMNGALN